nr:Photosystem I chlorophyll A apoprotein A1 [Ipomoea batatas]
MSFFLKGLRFITPKAFSELLKLSREYQMLTVTKPSSPANLHSTTRTTVSASPETAAVKGSASPCDSRRFTSKFKHPMCNCFMRFCHTASPYLDCRPPIHSLLLCVSASLRPRKQPSQLLFVRQRSASPSVWQNLRKARKAE